VLRVFLVDDRYDSDEVQECVDIFPKPSRWPAARPMAAHLGSEVIGNVGHDDEADSRSVISRRLGGQVIEHRPAKSASWGRWQAVSSSLRNERSGCENRVRSRVIPGIAAGVRIIFRQSFL
jgi:hypothetical protein